MPHLQPPVRLPWMDEAACARPEVNPDWWFTGQPDHEEVARLYCASCDVGAHCLEYAVQNTDISAGIWAGLHLTQIRGIRRQRRKA